MDVLKNRLQNLPAGQSTRGMIVDMLRNEGLTSFYKGLSANFMRLGCWNVLIFVALDQIKLLFED